MTDSTKHKFHHYFESVFDAAREAMFYVDTAGRLLRVNPALCRLVGYSATECRERPLRSIMAPQDDQQRLPSIVWQAEKRAVNAALRSRQGDLRPVRLRTFVVRNDGGGVEHLVGVAIPVMDRSATLAQSRISEAQQNLEDVLSNSGDGIILCDVEGFISKVNDALLQLVGYTEDELLGNMLVELSPFEGVHETTTGERVHIDEEYLAYQMSRANELFRSGKVANYELYLIRKDGVLVPVEATVSLLTNQQGERRGTITIVRDISARRRADSELLEAKARLEEANDDLKHAIIRAEKMARAAWEADQAKGQFLANMSHEIRTPMNGVIGFTEMLLDTELTPEQIDIAGTIKRSAEALLTIINDILDFSKIEAGQLDLAEVEFDPEAVVYEVCHLLQPRLEGKTVELVCQSADELPAKLVGDPNRFRQVVTNLVSNAIKFTEQGEIVVALSTEERGDQRTCIQISVRDTGIGIDAQHLDTVFEAFKQADWSISRAYGGTGLGLAISRKLAALMGGDVWVESTPGAGSVFFFSAWLRLPQTAAAAAEPPDVLHNRRVLVVDDNATSLAVQQQILERAGMQVSTLDDAAAVVDAVRAAQLNRQPFEVLVLDMHMPGLSGYEVLDCLRSSGLLACPVVASSSVADGSASLSRDGFSAVVPKPVNRRHLLETLARLITGAQLQEPAAAVPEEPDARVAMQGTVLLVEDNEVNCKLASRILTRAGYQVCAVRDGCAAVETYCGAPERYDLILMDIQMPRMSGIEATRAIRERGFSDVPIIALTAQAMKGDSERCLAAGMNDYLTKPIKRDVLLAKVLGWLPT